jgi:hypothetical protein
MFREVLRQIRRQPVAFVALFFALSGGAYAVAGNPFVGKNGTVSVCVQPVFNELKAVAPGAKCPNGYVALTLNQRGKPGPRGSRGATGAQGPKGNTGAMGARGPKGNAGDTGAQGPPGPAGPQGSTGPAGSLSSAYFDAYNSSSHTVNSNSDVPFDTLAVVPVGIGTNAADNAFTVSNAGKYLINVVFPPSLGPFSARLTVNDTALGPTEGVSFSRILSLSAGDVVTVRNVQPVAADVGTGSGITIVRIS